MRPPETVMIAITLADDTLAVMSVVTIEYADDGTVRWTRPATKDVVDAEVARTPIDADKLPIKGWRPIDPRDVPTDRTYRNALRDTGSALAHDMDHVRRLALDDLRVERAPALAELDAKWNRATGQGDAKQAAVVEAERQRLRDLPATLAAALAGAVTVEDAKRLRETVK